MHKDERHLQLLPDDTSDESDRVETLCSVPQAGAPRSIRILARGWLIERARSRHLRKMFRLARFEAAAERALKLEALDTYVEQCEEIAELQSQLDEMTATARRLAGRLRDQCVGNSRADALQSGMLVQVLPGDRPMRLDRVERTTHNGRPCLVLHGVQRAACGGVEPVEFWVEPEHTVQPFALPSRVTL